MAAHGAEPANGCGCSRRRARSGSRRPASTAAGRAPALGRDPGRGAAAALRRLPAHVHCADGHAAGPDPAAGPAAHGARRHAVGGAELVPGAGGAARARPDDGLDLARAHRPGAGRDRAGARRGGGRGAQPARVAQGVARVGPARARPGALSAPRPPALARVPAAPAGAAERSALPGAGAPGRGPQGRAPGGSRLPAPAAHPPTPAALRRTGSPTRCASASRASSGGSAGRPPGTWRAISPGSAPGRRSRRPAAAAVRRVSAQHGMPTFSEQGIAAAWRGASRPPISPILARDALARLASASEKRHAPSACRQGAPA